MKSLLKIIITFTWILFTAVISPPETNAEAACPSAEMQCQQLDAQGGCASPCIRVVTQIGNMSPSWCQCQVSDTDPGTVQCGGTCQTSSDCGSTCPFCRASHSTGGQVCQT